VDFWRSERPRAALTVVEGGKAPGEGAREGARHTLVRVLATQYAQTVELAKSMGPDGYARYLVRKHLSPALAQEPAALRAFVAAARRQSRIEAAHVEAIVELGSSSDFPPWIALDPTPAVRLSEVLLRGSSEKHPLALPLVCRILADVASGLAAAHAMLDRHGHALPLVHGALSDECILVTSDGTTKIIDFAAAAAARAVGRLPSGAPLPAGLRAPAVASVHDDIAALAVLAIELATGKALRADALVEPSVERLLADTQSEHHELATIVARIVRRAVTRDSQGRHRSAEEVAEAFRWAMDRVGASVGDDDLAELTNAGAAPDGIVETTRRSFTVTTLGPAATDAETTRRRRSDRPRWAALSAAVGAGAFAATLLFVGTPDKGARGRAESASRGDPTLGGSFSSVWAAFMGPPAAMLSEASEAKAFPDNDSGGALTREDESRARPSPAGLTRIAPTVAVEAVHADDSANANANASAAGPTPVATAPAPTRLAVTCAPACDAVSLEGRKLGASPIAPVEVSPGRHVLSVRRGGRVHALEIDVARGADTKVHVTR
jgi:serine/threonine-protein kinase